MFNVDSDGAAVAPQNVPLAFAPSPRATEPAPKAAVAPPPALSASDTRRLPDRGPSVTPLDLRQARFRTTLRGFDRAEVASFLLEAGEGYEQALRDNERLRQDVARLEAALTHYRVLEGTLKSTLMTAQQVSDNLRETAAQEAARIVREAEGRAGLLMDQAHARLEDVQREIDGLTLKRRETETTLESLISSLQITLDFVREQERKEMARGA